MEEARFVYRMIGLTEIVNHCYAILLPKNDRKRKALLLPLSRELVYCIEYLALSVLEVLV